MSSPVVRGPTSGDPAADGAQNSAPAANERRAYRSARRQKQAAETRALVVAAATTLFAERGWATTGMRDVAKAAGVSVETVYANFRSKSDLLLTAIDVGVAAASEPPVTTRSTMSQAIMRAA